MIQNNSGINKEAVIAAALSTEEARIALSQAMVEPIARALHYQAIGRKLMMVGDFECNAEAAIEECFRQEEQWTTVNMMTRL